MLRITTVSGRVYDLDLEAGYWRRSGTFSQWERLWGYKAGTVLAFPWHAPEKWESRVPEVGEHLFVTSRDVWYVSTEIASIEEVPVYASSE